MADDDVNLIELRPGVDLDDEGRVLHVVHREEGRPCFHESFEIRDEPRRVFCRDCRREVPPFDALERIASNVESFVRQRREFERRMKVARENLAETERLERNAKARVRKALSRIGVCECRSSWSGWGSAYWRFCPLCGGTRPEASAEDREADRIAVAALVQERGCAELLDQATRLLAGALDETDTDEGLEQVQTFLVERLSDALVPVVRRHKLGR